MVAGDASQSRPACCLCISLHSVKENLNVIENEDVPTGVIIGSVGIGVSSFFLGQSCTITPMFTDVVKEICSVFRFQCSLEKIIFEHLWR